MCKTCVISGPETGDLILGHQRIDFPTYPWEWTPDQWHAAAELTLNLCEEAIADGWILKDATPLNILFDGPNPVLVDVLSAERRNPGQPVWMAYAQFVRTFLLPLMARQRFGWPLQSVLNRRDGYEPDDLYPHLSLRQRWQYPFRSLVTLPVLLNRRQNKNIDRQPDYHREVSAEVADAMLHHTLRSLRKALKALRCSPQASRWSSYTKTAAHYSEQDHDAKMQFVKAELALCSPRHVLDVGANTGRYSRLAASLGASVVAWDSDTEATSENWRLARDQQLNILPLVADFARPTPAVGWCNQESLSLIERSEQRFDCILMLGILHHLLLSDQIPLAMIAELTARITRRWLLIEWIPATDSQFISLCRGREALYSHLSQDAFLQAFSKHFTVRKQSGLPNQRTLWMLEKQETRA